MPVILVPIPSTDFDPTEVASAWRMWSNHTVVFATPDGRPGTTDQRMLNGDGLAPFTALLRAKAGARADHAAMAASSEFRSPIRWDDINIDDIDAVYLPGGHAKGMVPYLESKVLQQRVAEAFARNLPVAAICHGVVLAARSISDGGHSVLYDRRTTALTRSMELTAWGLTRWKLGSYYRTYPVTVQAEVTAALRTPNQFLTGPPPLRRDTPTDLSAGFVVRDGNYLSGRWPGDVHRVATELSTLLS